LEKTKYSPSGRVFGPGFLEKAKKSYLVKPWVYEKWTNIVAIIKELKFEIGL
jgi:hypothetical protein